MIRFDDTFQTSVSVRVRPVFALPAVVSYSDTRITASVAPRQRDAETGLGAGGRRFESYHPDQSQEFAESVLTDTRQLRRSGLKQGRKATQAICRATETRSGGTEMAKTRRPKTDRAREIHLSVRTLPDAPAYRRQRLSNRPDQAYSMLTGERSCHGVLGTCLIFRSPKSAEESDQILRRLDVMSTSGFVESATHIYVDSTAPSGVSLRRILHS